jgi:hypothetical protein
MEKLLRLFVHQDGLYQGAFRENEAYRLEEFRNDIEGLTPFCDGDLRERLFWLSRGITERKQCPVCGKGLPWHGRFAGFGAAKKHGTDHFKEYCSDRCRGRDSNCWTSSKAKGDLKNIVGAVTLRDFVEKWLFTENGIINVNISRIVDDNFRNVLKKCVPEYVGLNLIEHLFWFMNGFTDYPKTCKRNGCEKKVTFFKSWSYDIRDFCSCLCSGSDKNLLKQKFQTKLLRYGNGQNTQKIIKTCRSRYGVDNVMHVPEIFERTMRNQMRWKPFELPSGRIIKVQGYEDRALTILLENYVEEDLVTGKSVPRIKWTDGQGKEHTHYPDIFIEKENRLIEVKSSWTMKCQGEDTVYRKKSAAEAMGYTYDLMIL